MPGVWRQARNALMKSRPGGCRRMTIWREGGARGGLDGSQPGLMAGCQGSLGVRLRWLQYLGQGRLDRQGLRLSGQLLPVIWDKVGSSSRHQTCDWCTDMSVMLVMYWDSVLGPRQVITGRSSWGSGLS